MANQVIDGVARVIDPAHSVTSLAVRESAVVAPIVTAAEAAQQWQAYQELTRRILDPTDYTTIDGKKRKNKSAWRKLGTYYNLTDRIIESASFIQRDNLGLPVYAHYEVEAIAPNGRVAVGVQEAHAAERCCPSAWREPCDRLCPEGCDKKHAHHVCCPPGCSGRRHWAHPGDIVATAHTRAKNRALADLIGAGEVSAEEMIGSEDVAFADFPILETCPVHSQKWREGKFGPYHGLQPKGFCNLRDVLQSEFQAACKARGLDGKAAAGWLSRQGFLSWSKMTDQDKAKAIELLGEPDQPPPPAGNDEPVFEDEDGDYDPESGDRVASAAEWLSAIESAKGRPAAGQALIWVRTTYPKVGKADVPDYSQLTDEEWTQVVRQLRTAAGE
jgi:hypothetical protein